MSDRWHAPKPVYKSTSGTQFLAHMYQLSFVFYILHCRLCITRVPTVNSFTKVITTPTGGGSVYIVIYRQIHTQEVLTGKGMKHQSKPYKYVNVETAIDTHKTVSHAKNTFVCTSLIFWICFKNRFKILKFKSLSDAWGFSLKRNLGGIQTFHSLLGLVTSW